MVSHIVMFKFQDNIQDDKAHKAKDMILSLKELVPVVLDIEAGLNFSNEDRSMDLSLSVKLQNREDLDTYVVHPEHIKVVNYLKSIISYSKVVDYEI